MEKPVPGSSAPSRATRTTMPSRGPSGDAWFDETRICALRRAAAWFDLAPCPSPRSRVDRSRPVPFAEDPRGSIWIRVVRRGAVWIDLDPCRSPTLARGWSWDVGPVHNGRTMEQKIQIPMAEATASGYLYTEFPEGERPEPRPGVVFLTDAGGMRPSAREAAQRLANQGFTVLLPNVFYRVGDPPFFTPPLDLQDPKVRATFAALVGSLPPSNMEADGGYYVDFLAARPETADRPIGVVGHCMTGSMALRTAAARPDVVGAAASFHGGRLYVDSPESSHLVLPRVKARLYFGHAENDRSMPAEAIEKLESALAAWGGQYESEVYAGALHGWTTTDSPVYHEQQADRAFQKLLGLLASHR